MKKRLRKCACQGGRGGGREGGREGRKEGGRDEELERRREECREGRREGRRKAGGQMDVWESKPYKNLEALRVQVGIPVAMVTSNSTCTHT